MQSISLFSRILFVVAIFTWLMYREVRWHDKKTMRYRVFGQPQAPPSGSNGIILHSLTTQDSNTQQSESQAQQQQQQNSIRQRSSTFKAIASFLSSLPPKKKKPRHPRTQEVFEQAMLYVMAFYFVHTWSTLNRIVQQFSGRVYFPLAVLHATVKPLQGCINFMVYQRPRYRKIRSSRPELSVAQVMCRVVRFSVMPPLEGMSTLRSHNTSSQSRGDGRQSPDHSNGEEPSLPHAQQSTLNDIGTHGQVNGDCEVSGNIELVVVEDAMSANNGLTISVVNGSTDTGTNHRAW
jgi:hypothetical protein